MRPWLAEIIWDDDDDPEGNVQHVAEHDLTKDEVESVLQNPRNVTTRSRSSGRPCTFGWTDTGRYVTVIWDEANDDPAMLYPVTAYDTEPPA